MSIITAEEARELTGPSTEECLEIIDKHIRQAAQDKKTSLILRDKPFCDWLYEETSEKGKLIIEKLKLAGYKVELHYIDGRQFTDYGLKISW